MLLTETMGHEQEQGTEEEPEQFFARYILSRSFENERGRRGQTVLKVGLVGPNTAYEIILLKAADTGEIHAGAVESGMRTMRADGLSKACAGLTTIDEVLRVTQEVLPLPTGRRQ